MSECLFTATEAVWFLYLLKSIRYSYSSIKICVNNQAVIVLAKNQMYQQRTKHIDLKYHWKCEICEAGKISISYTPTSQILADGLTKALARPKTQELARAMKLDS
ncbi:uncharacterized protein VP01_1939g5 [Puccinia sorghi]|uniref:Copia protein n=1 Tax=Puccinia sorghi TaxID=27349 RepID=A0A0L6VCD3_9BASI|nr:uncharacterized protein VP01_1939g5 [Puccinia sorghi]